MASFVLPCTDVTFMDSVYQWPPDHAWIAKRATRCCYFPPQHGNWWRFEPVDAGGSVPRTTLYESRTDRSAWSGVSP